MVFMNSLYMDLVYFIICVCSFIPVWVFLLLSYQLGFDNTSMHANESGELELFWTAVPTATVTVMCLLNVQCMSLDYLDVPNVIVKVVGRQWYWSYDVQGFEGEYDSVIGDFVSSVDKPLRLCLHVFHRFLVTSSDVIHSFSVPRFNMKLDAIPGRINHVLYCPDRLGVFVGYCTELCGAGHAYMPVVVEVVTSGLSCE
uniref:cytochrome-c oxidase n=1 Tax=Echinochasmus japonicus TaxID=1197313 RepID=A0A186QE47_9TREM|nr:cytochrome c oxidase subunit II [Echinochasmus japonicus]AKL39065.1 cytochrome c oxidase subunit II [Echinochasmus japonicus]